MLKRRLLIAIAVIFILVTLITLLIGTHTVMEWFREQWLDLFYAAVMAVAAGVLIHYAYIKIVPKPKILQNTIIMKQKKAYNKLILPNNNEIRITENEKLFGREDFVGVVSTDELLFIGRKHFKTIKLDEMYYIEDLGTKNGTKLNGEELGLEKQELKNGDELFIGNVLKVKYITETP